MTHTVDDALRAELAAEGETRPIVGWVAAVAVLADDEEETVLRLVTPAGQQPFSTAGLLHLGITRGLGAGE